MLGVASATLNDHGAVSEQVAAEMAKGALRLSARRSRFPSPASPGRALRIQARGPGLFRGGDGRPDLYRNRGIRRTRPGRRAPGERGPCARPAARHAGLTGSCPAVAPCRSASCARASKARTIRCIASWKNSPAAPCRSLFLNSKSTSKATSQPPSSRIAEDPGGVHVLERALDILGIDPARALPHRDPRQEAFAEHLEAHDQVREHHVALALGRHGPHARGRDPRDELRIIRDIATRSYICSAV
jgi:hypothetical protein